ncbi:four-helix bundle copper-binding protein [Salmonella enterica subsp. enterica serovar Infantis]|nr:four-helix bundle copper-binding protein [Salmonella enterica subsp. enterica serovar Infantis]
MQQEHRECIEQCYECAAARDICASSCLREDNVEMMKHCIQLDMQCAAICRLAAQFMALESEYSQKLCRLCADICKACAEECARHDHDHCQNCARACSQCADACLKMAA